MRKVDEIKNVVTNNAKYNLLKNLSMTLTLESVDTPK